MTAIETTFDDGVTAHVPAGAPQITPMGLAEPELAQEVKNLVRGELSNFLSDVEFRLQQTTEINRRMLAALDKMGGGSVDFTADDEAVLYAEDLNVLMHIPTGYTVTSNSPGAGSIAWASLFVTYNGTMYTITNGNTANKFVWFDAAVSTTVLQSSNTKPTLAGNACLLFVNNAGVVIEVLNASIPPVVANAAIDTGALQDNAVTTAKIPNGAITAAKTDFAATFATDITAALTAAQLAQATADGAIQTYFQPNAPWANGTTQPVGVVGDVWYDQDDGKAYRWSGAAGSPANTWVEIVDTQAAAALAAANTANAGLLNKITTFYAPLASVPTATAVGDLWIVTDQGNQTRRATATGTGSWVTVQLGTAALADNAVTDVKVASGIAGTKLTAGTVGATQIGSGAITPVKLNVLQHFIS